MRSKRNATAKSVSKNLLGNATERIEAILNDYDPFDQNKIINEVVKNTAIKRFEDDEAARSKRNKTLSALEEFVKQNPSTEKLIAEFRHEKEVNNGH